MAEHVYKDFDEWMDETEIFSQRRERFEIAVYSCSVDELTAWMRAAWELGSGAQPINPTVTLGGETVAIDVLNLTSEARTQGQVKKDQPKCTGDDSCLCPDCY